MKKIKKGFYWLSNSTATKVYLVRVYVKNGVRGIGFGEWDGSEFVPLSDLLDNAVLTPIFRTKEIRELLLIQGTSGNWDFDPYMHGMYNGLETALSILECRAPNFKERPKKWGYKKSQNLISD